MAKLRQIKIVFIVFIIGSSLFLSSSLWLPFFIENKATIDLIKEDLTLKGDNFLLEAIENYSDISAPVEKDNYKKNYNLYSSSKKNEKTYANYLNEIIIKFSSYRDSETNRDKIVLYKAIVEELIVKYDFVVSLKEISTSYESSSLSKNDETKSDSEITNEDVEDGPVEDIQLPNDLRKD